MSQNVSPENQTDNASIDSILDDLANDPTCLENSQSVPQPATPTGQKAAFVHLRAQGLSFRKIADRLGVPRSTLFRWSKELSVQISNHRAVEFEALCEEYLVCKQHRIKVLATQLHEVMQEILNRDLSSIPTWRLFQVQAKLSHDLILESEQFTLTNEEPLSPLQTAMQSLNKKQTWKA